MADVVIAIALSIAAVVILLGLIAFLIFACWKFYDYHSRLNSLEEQIEYLQDVIVNNDTNTGNVGKVVLRKKRNSDSAIDVRTSSQSINNDLNLQQEQSDLQNNKPVIRPQFTIKIKKQTANVYGHIKPDSQVVAIAQSFYKQKTNSDCLVGVDDMQISLEKEHDSARQPSIYEGRPTSILDLSDQDMANVLFEKGIFVHKTLPVSGGTLELYGVKLVVPDSALSKNTKISLGITWDASVYPKLEKSKALLSPVVVCQPTLVFLKPVTLTFPHCAVKPKVDWKLSVIQRENDLHAKEDEWVSTDVSNVIINDQYVELTLKHFTLYTLIGESNAGKMAAKAVKMLAFTSPFQMNKMFTVRIYCINSYEEDSAEMKIINSTSLNVKEKQADAPLPLFIHNNGKDVLVNLKEVTKGWNVNGKHQQVIDFECIWHCLSPSCKFLFQPSDNYLRKIVCDFEYFQNSEKKQSLQVAGEQVQHTPIALRENLNQEYGKMKKLILLLDPNSDNDYRILAEKLGYSFDEIKWLETQPSPTQTILEKWVENGKQIKDLETYLKEMGRLDAISEINDTVLS